MTEMDVYDRPPVYEDDKGRIIYRASSLGFCIGALVRARLGVTGSPPSDMMLERFQEGHDWEQDVLTSGLGVDWLQVTNVDHLQLYGTPLEGGQVETELTWGNRVVRCHPDAIATHRGSLENHVVEVKFLSEEFAAEKIRAVGKQGMLGLGDTYAWQASVEMLTTNLPMLYVIGEKEVEGEGDAREVVGVKNITTFEWSTPCFSLIDVKMRVAEVEGWVTRGEMPPCPQPFMYPCPYWAEHIQPDKAPDVDDEMLVHLLESYERNASKLTAVAGEKEQIRASIDQRLSELGLEKASCAGWNLAMTDSRPGNVSWAKWAKAVKKKHPEVSDVLEDDYRGDEVAGGLRMEKKKVDGK